MGAAGEPWPQASYPGAPLLPLPLIVALPLILALPLIPTPTPTPNPNPTQERPSSRSAAERLHASAAEHFPNPVVLTPLLPSPGHTSEGPRGGKSRRQTPSRSPARSPPQRSPARSPPLRSPVRSPGARGQLGQRNSPSPHLGADLPDLVAFSAATPSVPAEAGITGWG